MNWNKHFHYLAASCFYVGNTPMCPGSIASLVAATIFFMLPQIPLGFQVLLIVIGVPLAIWVSELAAKQSTQHDPSWIVIDEFVGMYIAILGLPKIWWLYLAAFILFRFFDISKIFPINVVEKRWPGGIGIVMDDVLAGIFARFTLYLVILISF